MGSIGSLFPIPELHIPLGGLFSLLNHCGRALRRQNTVDDVVDDVVVDDDGDDGDDGGDVDVDDDADDVDDVDDDAFLIDYVNKWFSNTIF